MYRVRDVKHNKWIDKGVYLNTFGDLVKIKKSFFRTKEKLFNHSNYELQYSTGIKDKNNILVYEGDIIIADIMGEEIKTLCVFSDYICSYVLLDFISNKYYTLSKDKSRVIKVIGNIYDNQELIKGNKE